MARIIITLVWLSVFFMDTNAIIAYDCQNQRMNLTTFSLIDIGACRVPTKQVMESEERIQLVQLHDVDLVHVYQCKIHVTRLVSHCGMHSHMSAVTNGLATYIYPISRDVCMEMHRTQRAINFIGKTIEHLTINGTTHAAVLMAGRITAGGNCHGAYYEDHKGSWQDVIVHGALEITLFQKTVAVEVDENRIILPGGITCPYKERKCVDTIYGYTFWEYMDNGKCFSTRFNVLYEGPAKRLVPTNASESNYDTVVYVVDRGNTVFAMPVSRPTVVCFQNAYETDHPRFFVIKPSVNGQFYFKKGNSNIYNMDPTTYVNTKIVFLERHFRTQLSALYNDVIVQRCNLEQQVLRNLQILAITAPMEFAYAKMKMPGYMAVTYGELVHLIQCTPVEVQIKKSTRCYHELPVQYENETYFMAPRSHVLQKFGTEISCSPFLYSAYKFGGKWYKTTQELHEIPNPQVMEPSNENKWVYKNPNNLFTGGLYSQEDMEKLRKHIIIPTERQAVEGIVTRGMMGMSTDMQGTNVRSLFPDETIKSWINETWSSITTWFTLFGTYSSGVIGIFLIVRAVKFVVDTIVHGIVLYDMFGWSIKLIVAVWDSVTAYFIHRERQRREKTVEIQIEDGGATPPTSDPGNKPTAPSDTKATVYPSTAWLKPA